ncbi:hypothetical protein CEP54_014970 [Fusarium duplospermum]|uniref:Uncharacterized protein n=1 Tax=Fusarium duplospermum TaxID=1325734 RepID=A0A428NSF6_9HYPO|nr:hypothetical protein CEP54_014970 [Fusarium duplospermum]
MKYPPRRHRHRAHVSRAQPYTTTQYRIARRLCRPNVWSRHRQHRQFAGPPQSTLLRQRTVARLDPQSPAYQPAGDEGPGYQDERGNYGEGFVGNYGDDFVGDYGDGFVSDYGDYGEENACQNHPELEQCMSQIIEIARNEGIGSANEGSSTTGFGNARGSTRTAD